MLNKSLKGENGGRVALIYNNFKLKEQECCMYHICVHTVHM